MTLGFRLCLIFVSSPGPSWKRDLTNVCGTTWVNNDNFLGPWINVYTLEWNNGILELEGPYKLLIWYSLANLRKILAKHEATTQYLK